MKKNMMRTGAYLALFSLAACGGDSNNSGAQLKPNSEPTLLPVEIKSIDLVARYQSGDFGKSAAEITDYHKASKRAFVVNAQAKAINVLDLSDLPANAVTGDGAFTLNNLKAKATRFNVGASLTPVNGSTFNVGAINSLSIVGDLMAVAVENEIPQDAGAIVFYRLDDTGTATKLHAVKAGAMPDMVTITPDGKFALSADEGEPNGSYSNDPEGTVTLVKINNGVPAQTSQQLNFHSVSIPDEVIIKKSIKDSSANSSSALARDLEPEYIAVSEDSKKAWVSLQENNALALIDLTANTPKIDKVVSLGFKDHGLEKNKLDANKDDKEGKLSAHTGLYGMYMPDTLASYTVGGKSYVLSANEGDGRDYKDRSVNAKYTNESQVKKLKKPLDSAISGLATPLKSLKVHSELGLNKTGTAYDKLYAFGTRSFSIWDDTGKRVYDSGSIIEEEVLKANKDYFNTTSTKAKVDDRSDNKGPEPEAIEVAKIGASHFAIVGLERQGGFMVFDVTNPRSVKYVSYINNRNFDLSNLTSKGKYKDNLKAGDLAPESIKFLPAETNSLNKPLLIVANEVSGSTSVYRINLK